MLYEDLTLCFSQKKSVSLQPAQRSLSKDITQECYEGGEGKIENKQQLSLETIGLEELVLEYSSTAVPFERKISGGTSAFKKNFISLLVTIENYTPLMELSQC